MKEKEESRANIWVYEKLRNQIENLELAPGLELNILSLSEELGVSRSPVRDALLRLERDRLVDIFPQRGTRVSYLDYDIIRQERFMRLRLEIGALEACIDKKRSAEELEAFVTRLRSNLLSQHADLISGEYKSFFAHDDELHYMFYTEASLERVWKVLKAHTGNEHRIRILSYRSKGIAESVEEDHEALVNAIAKSNKEEAVKIDTLHLSKLTEEIEALKEQFSKYFTN